MNLALRVVAIVCFVALWGCSTEPRPVVIEVRNASETDEINVAFAKQRTKKDYFTATLAAGESKQWSFIESDPDVGILTVRLKDGSELSAREHSIANGKVVRFLVTPDNIQITFVQEGVLNF